MEPAKIHAHDDIGFDTPGAGASVTDDDDDVVDVIVVAFQVGVWLIILFFSWVLETTSKQGINCIISVNKVMKFRQNFDFASRMRFDAFDASQNTHKVEDEWDDIRK